jgi:pyrroloquinoline quinone biosynthesis protein D
VVLFPEGLIRVQGTGQSILELCDGQRTLDQIVLHLSAQYESAEPEKIADEVGTFLEALQRKRIVDY